MQFNKIAANSLIAATATTLGSAASKIINPNISILGGIGFGVTQGIITRIAFDLLKGYVKEKDASKVIVLSELIGATVAVGLNIGASALGLISTPVSIPMALAMTVGIVALKIILGKGRQYQLESALKSVTIRNIQLVAALVISKVSEKAEELKAKMPAISFCAKKESKKEEYASELEKRV